MRDGQRHQPALAPPFVCHPSVVRRRRFARHPGALRARAAINNADIYSGLNGKADGSVRQSSSQGINMTASQPALVSQLNALDYRIEDVGKILTPALAIYPRLVDANIAITIDLLGGDANRWRPHVKTS